MEGAAMDFRFSHQINHIIVGNLGDLEILLFAYDDGDIAAYYTHAIAHCIKLNSDQGRDLGPCPGRQGKHPKLFFHENVLKSAWGIAIHEQSRLIAVSTNFHEVTVFAFALSHTDTVIKFPEVDESPKLRCGLTALELEKHFRSRTRTWRIVLPLGRSAGNVPNIAFVDDETGEAEKVVAIDLSGTAWFLDIWGIGPSTIRWADPCFRDHQMMHRYAAHYPAPCVNVKLMQSSIRGWGVLVLPYSSFKPTKTVHESLGVPGNQVIAVTKPDEANRVWLDTTCSLYYIKGFSSNPEGLFRQRPPRVDYARIHATKPECQEDDLSDVWESDSDSDEDDDDVYTTTAPGTVGSKVTYPLSAGLENQQWSAITPYKGKAAPSLGDMSDEMQLGRCIVPSVGDTPRLGSDLADHVRFARTYAERQAKTKPVDYSKSDFSSHLIKNFCLLRTSMTSIELQPFDRDAPCIECKYLLAHDQRTGPDTPWDLHGTYSERVSMLLHVPELNLVVAGSPTGRVALITLTKTAKRLHLTRVRHGFRVDCVLPRKAEVAQRIRPVCPLIGVAMSPVPCQPGKSLELRPERRNGAAAAPAVYRLMLHYKNHTILMYDVARGGGEDDELLIF
jgi:hypothetical protein